MAKRCLAGLRQTGFVSRPGVLETCERMVGGTTGSLEVVYRSGKKASGVTLVHCKHLRFVVYVNK